MSEVVTEVVKELTDPVMIIALGIIGGALAELVKWFKLRESPNLPVYIRSALYWIVTIIMILAGGFVAWVYGEIGPLNALLAINVGASTPLIISGLVKTPPPKPEMQTLASKTGETKSKLREFLSWR